MTATTMINENAEVRVYKGEDICHECGRCIRNIVEIDGVAFGVRCCEKYLPRTHKVDHKRGVVVQVETSLETAQRIFADDAVFPRFWAQPVWQLEAFLLSRPDSPRYAGVAAIVKAKKAA
jgi:hypothetical protein